MARWYKHIWDRIVHEGRSLQNINAMKPCVLDWVALMSQRV